MIVTRGISGSRLKRWIAILTKASEEIEQQLAKEKWELDGFESSDPIVKRLSQIFPDDRVGEQYPDMLEVYERAAQRILSSIPPGFKDARKTDYRRYGDVVLWFQLLDYAKQSKKPMIFITSDSKDDWWQQQGNKTVGPRPELIQEMHVVANVSFHMYTTANFMEHAQKYFDLQAEAAKIRAAATELRNIGTTEVVSPDFQRALLSNLYPNLAALSQPPLSELIIKSHPTLADLIKKSQPNLNLLDFPLDSIRKGFEETVFGPLSQIRSAAQQLADIDLWRRSMNPFTLAALASAKQANAVSTEADKGATGAKQADETTVSVNATKRDDDLPTPPGSSEGAITGVHDSDSTTKADLPIAAAPAPKEAKGGDDK